MSPFGSYTSLRREKSRARTPRPSSCTHRPSHGTPRLTDVFVVADTNAPWEEAGQSVPVPAPAAPGPRADICLCISHKAAFPLNSSQDPCRRVLASQRAHDSPHYAPAAGGSRGRSQMAAKPFNAPAPRRSEHHRHRQTDNFHLQRFARAPAEGRK